MEFLAGCVVGGIIGILIMGLMVAKDVDTKSFSYNLRKKILLKLNHNKECWEHLAEQDNLYLIGKIEAMDMAIRIVVREFDKAKSEVERE